MCLNKFHMDASILRSLKESGWVFSQEDLLKYIEEECEEEVVLHSLVDWSKFLLDVDLHKIPEQSAVITLNQALQLPQILQIDKIRNVALPKVNENEEKGGPRILKVSLTDGHSTSQALELSRIDGLSADTPPGTKVWLAGASVPFERNFFLLNNSNCKVLGGNVEEMVEKWKANRETRGKQRQQGGAPAWVPFGKAVDTSANLTRGFESMSVTKTETGPPVPEQFEQTRSAVIAQVVQTSGTGAARFQQPVATSAASVDSRSVDPVQAAENSVHAYQNRQNQHQQQQYSDQPDRYSNRGGGRNNGRSRGRGGGGRGGRRVYRNANYY